MFKNTIIGSGIVIIAAGFIFAASPAWADCPNGESSQVGSKCSFGGCKQGWSNNGFPLRPDNGSMDCYQDVPADKVARPMKQVKNIFTGEVTGAVYDNCASNTQTPIDGYCYWCSGGREIVALLSWKDQGKCRQFQSSDYYLDYSSFHTANAEHQKERHSGATAGGLTDGGGGSASGNNEPETPVDPAEPTEAQKQAQERRQKNRGRKEKTGDIE